MKNGTFSCLFAHFFRIQLLSQKLNEYFIVMRKYYGNCAQAFLIESENTSQSGDNFGTDKFRHLMQTLREERAREVEDNKRREIEEEDARLRRAEEEEKEKERQA